MKNLFLIIFILPYFILAQAPGANCGTAANVVVNSCTGSQAGIGNNIDDGLAVTCTGTFSRDAWWQFTATATNTVLTFSNSTTNDNPSIFYIQDHVQLKPFWLAIIQLMQMVLIQKL